MMNRLTGPSMRRKSPPRSPLTSLTHRPKRTPPRRQRGFLSYNRIEARRQKPEC
jgi:hypothetical protein